MTEIFCNTIQISNENSNFEKSKTADPKLFDIELSAYVHLVPQLIVYLDEDETAHAEKFHFNNDKYRFIICRSLLKFILAQHTGFNISDLKIGVGSNKKPYLISKKRVHFNLSHTENRAIIAVSQVAVGIDIEYINQDFDFSDMLHHIYSEQEITSVLNAEDSSSVFYRFWTRKEAMVKATGQGISDDLPLIPATDGSHMVDKNILEGFKSLQVLSFHLNQDHIVAIALESKRQHINSLSIYNLPESIDGLLAFSELKWT